MTLPKFLMGDNTDFPNALFVIHTEFPRFVIDLTTDDIEWLEELDASEKNELEMEMVNLIEQASNFYDREISRYEE